MESITMFNLRRAIIVCCLGVLFCTSTASAQFDFFIPLQCRRPIDVRVSEIVNNCDGTVTANFEYNNPNRRFWFFGWRNCPTINIAHGNSGPFSPFLALRANRLSPGSDAPLPTAFSR